MSTSTATNHISSMGSQEMFRQVVEFVEEKTAGRDASHDFCHHINVYNLSLELLRDWMNENPTAEIYFNKTCAEIRTIVTLAALLHDIPDHKYHVDTAEPLAEIFIRVSRWIGPVEAKIVTDIIRNISYSREVRGELEDLGEWQFARDIVSDADKITALGPDGLKRCYNFQRAMNPELDHDAVMAGVRQHCADKLCHLIRYIRTPAGKIAASEPQQYIRDFHDGKIPFLL